jgi:radical SAM protein with 4Fe4S-binding SPASM domain
MRPTHTRADFDHSPMIVFYETTRACDLACVHCRANAQRECDPNELSTAAARRMIADLTKFPKPPLLVLTGGDPIKRADVFDLIASAREQGLQVAMTPSATPLVTPSVIRRLKESGLHRLAVSLDGADAATHDDFRRVAGSFSRTLRIIDRAGRFGLPVQVNTTVGRHNVHQLEQIARLIARRGVVLWSIFFIVPTGRATQEQRLDAEEVEATFARIHRLCGLYDLPVKTTEAPHYRRYVLQQLDGTGGRPIMQMPGMGGTNDGKGILFISHTGEIYPSGFLPIACGRVPLDSVVRVYQDATLFRALRDADRLGGKCGRCEFRQVCGGSRARAYAVSGDPLAAEPDCAYEPPPRPARLRTEREPAAGPQVRSSDLGLSGCLAVAPLRPRPAARFG